MLKLLVVLTLAAAILPNTAYADGTSYLTAPAPRSLRSDDRGGTMKKHGIAASILGILQLSAGMAAGIVSIVPCHSERSNGCGGNVVAFASGATFTALGAISASAGIPMWIYGAREERAARLRLTAMGTGLRITF